ncbi:TRAP transporter large permease [Oceanobacillus halophilus]|uniref:TRAP transporter large permease n=1 Tax=Oceanobacillus halophilus TaxID=930130 RepID=A0A495A850_9BACI|nr:TRAP transporter large permease [Oceanobacillus halophilus]RKQ35784.1 TRAP transporter large permease [Oceanobacillus halophilus]
MEWYIVITLFFVLLMLFILTGFPVAFGFIAVNIILTILFIGLDGGLQTFVRSAFESLGSFSLTPIPLFILMGEVLFHSGLVMKLIDVLSRWMGRLPSRLSILTMAAGTLFSALSGSAVANAAMLGSSMTPEMEKRGYHLKMSVGPILGAGALATIIPPSTTAILLGGLGGISVGDLLIGGVIPGILLAVLMIIYFMALGIFNPSVAPVYDVDKTSWNEKLRSLVFDAVPLMGLIVLVVWLIFSGFATPTESAAIGALGALLLPIVYGRLTVDVLKRSILGTLKVSGMILLILAASAGFSQLIAFTGAARGLVDAVLSLNVDPLVSVIGMLLIILILGTFIEPISILMITTPLYIPVVTALEFDLVWFGLLVLICLGIGNITPPFGLLLFVIRGVIPSNVSMKEIYKSVIGVITISLVGVIIIIIFPEIVTWLPSVGAD